MERKWNNCSLHLYLGQKTTTRSRWQISQRILLLGHAHMHVHMHSQIGGQVENITPPVASKVGGGGTIKKESTGYCFCP